MLQWNEFRSHVRYLPTADLVVVQKAFNLGMELHKDQKRRSGEPYFTHPIAVAHILADINADADTVIAALLHDTVEDTPITLDEVEDQFGKNIRSLIDGVTKLEPDQLPEISTVDDRIEYLRKMFGLIQEDVRIVVVKLADRLHNMQTIEYLSQEKQIQFAKETHEVYARLAGRLCMQDISEELESLSLAILEPDMFKKMQKFDERYEEESAEVAVEFLDEIEKHTTMDDIKIEFEYKNWRQLKEEIELLPNTSKGIVNTILSIICPDLDGVYKTLGFLHQRWQREELSFEDFISSPRNNGYRGLHTTIIIEDGSRIRCKIRTQQMHDYARKGITIFCFDKEAVGFIDYLPWTRRIETVTKDTEKQSDAFWESIQSDILGDTISVYTSGERRFDLPEGSTALDGVIYTYGQRALKLQEVLVNGKSVPLQSPLSRADVISITLSKDRTVKRDWLNSVNTGVAAAMIRTALEESPNINRAELGKTILQDKFEQQGRGSIDEFTETKAKEALKKLGCSTMEDLYLAIADGRIEPIKAFRFFYPKKSETTMSEKELYSYTSLISIKSLQDIEVTKSAVELLEKYKKKLQSLRMSFSPIAMALKISGRAKFSSSEQEEFAQDMQIHGFKNVSVRPLYSKWLFTSLFLLLFVLWGLDPVVSYHLIHTSVTPLQLTFIRYATFFVASTLLYVHYLWYNKRFKALSLCRITLWISGLMFFATGLFTYLSLQYLSPVEYIFFILMATITYILTRRHIEHKTYAQESISLATTIAMLAISLTIHSVPLTGIAYGFLACVSYALYTDLSYRYQKKEGQIIERYPAFMFWLSVASLPLAFVIFKDAHIYSLTPVAVFSAIAFSFFFVFIPYAFFHILSRKVDIKQLHAQLLLVALFTLIGELILLQTRITLLLVPALFVLLWWRLLSNDEDL